MSMRNDIEIEQMEMANEFIDTFVKVCKLTVDDMKGASEERIFDLKVNLDSLFFGLVDSIPFFIECIDLRLRVDDEFNGSAKWQKIFMDIYRTYKSME